MVERDGRQTCTGPLGSRFCRSNLTFVVSAVLFSYLVTKKKSLLQCKASMFPE